MLYALVNGDRMHHYGNDDDYADDIAKLVMATYCKYTEHRPTPHGGEYMPGVFSVTNNVMHRQRACRYAGRTQGLRAGFRLYWPGAYAVRFA